VFAALHAGGAQHTPRAVVTGIRFHEGRTVVGAFDRFAGPSASSNTSAQMKSAPTEFESLE
jgi:hypothetical protein